MTLSLPFFFPQNDLLSFIPYMIDREDAELYMFPRLKYWRHDFLHVLTKILQK